MMIKPQVAQMLRFGVVGVISTITLYSVYTGSLTLSLSPTVSYSIAYFCAFVVNYLLSTSFTFRVRKNVKNGIGFVLSNIINYFVSIGLLKLFLYIGLSHVVAPIPTLVLATISNYYIVKFVMKWR